MRGWIQATVLGLVLALPVLAVPVQAVQPDEILADPALEERARELSKGLRCLVCRNESIDESNADLARDLRLLVRERLVAGDDDDEVITFVVDRYGEYVLLQPKFTGSNWLLWAAGPFMLLLAAAVAFTYLRGREKAEPLQEAGLSPEESARLKRILEE
ncbi:cytochrome c-type biogenesis protein [Aestuariivita sp.]|jgi:cytochrome c-type biogenesis protein CcmH|uniref:cytochrome c-type biogenesis protein n=1 Tax=Aestuariivita sp. TaxID=1872407 RepID=UPI00217173C0|nr:cytochrome c-type biogenesis protein [Aestuariivita sp.]MCE8008054.1 cytochrome c-type biogenesis protein CcmH [Aestuariivita sp.]